MRLSIDRIRISRLDSFKQLVFSLLLIGFALPTVGAANWYVDGAAAGGNTGGSWENAWRSLASMKGLSPGDTVYISGGSTGKFQTYDIGGPTGQFTDLAGFERGTPDMPVTYKIGQDGAHNGTAIFHSTAGMNKANFLSGPANIIFSGEVAGDERMHFCVTNVYRLFNCDNTANVTISHVNCGNITTFGDANDANGIHIDHCFAYINYVHADHCTYGHFHGRTYGDNTCDHCTFYVPHDSHATAEGADCFQWNGSGFTISNNLIVGYDLSGANGNHQDGEQCTGGEDAVLICGNTFVNCGNSAIFGDCYFGGLSNFYVCDNLVLVSELAVNAGSPVGIQITLDGGYPGPGAPSVCPFVNVKVYNNDIVDLDTQNKWVGIQLNNLGSHASSFAHCAVANNIYVNSGAGISVTDSYGKGLTCNPTDNVILTAEQGPTVFVSYTTYGGLSNDMHLQASANRLIGKGTEVSEAVELPERIRGHPWNIGAFGPAPRQPHSSAPPAQR